MQRMHIFSAAPAEHWCARVSAALHTPSLARVTSLPKTRLARSPREYSLLPICLTSARISVWTIFSLIATVLFLNPVAAEDIHFIGPNKLTQESISPAGMSNRIEQTANEYKLFAPIPRVGLIDTAFPANSNEYKALNGFTVMLVSVLSQTSEELPPKRVYVKIGKGIIELKLLSSAFIEVDPTLLTANVFGKNRWDGLYLFPLYFKRDAQELLIDFAKNRNGFVLSKFSAEDVHELGQLPVDKPTSKEPNPEALRGIITREFPGFIGKTLPNDSLQPNRR